MSLANLLDDKFTSSEVKRILLAGYERKLSKRHENETCSEALQVTNGTEIREKVSANDKFRNIICCNCKKTGHIAKNCVSNIEKDKRNVETKPKRSHNAFLIALNYTLKIHGSHTVEVSIMCVKGENGSPHFKK